MPGRPFFEKCDALRPEMSAFCRVLIGGGTVRGTARRGKVFSPFGPVLVP